MTDYKRETFEETCLAIEAGLREGDRNLEQSLSEDGVYGDDVDAVQKWIELQAEILHKEEEQTSYCDANYLKEKTRKLVQRSHNAEHLVDMVRNEGQAEIKEVYRQRCIYEELLESEVALNSAIKHMERALPKDVVEGYTRSE